MIHSDHFKNQPLTKYRAALYIIYCETAGYWSFAITFHDATIQQLKNSGSLRYFSPELQYKVSEYDRKAESYQQDKKTKYIFSRITREMNDGAFDSETILETTARGTCQF
jgi:hypothetical protein